MIQRKDMLVLVIALLLALGLLVASRVGNAPKFSAPLATSESSESSESSEAPAASDLPAYLLVTVRGMQYTPIPLDQEANLVLRQKEAGTENVIHITPEGVNMASSTCNNQNCVDQGTITLQNRSTRLLQNMIICLPNEVTLELLTASEAEGMLP